MDRNRSEYDANVSMAQRADQDRATISAFELVRKHGFVEAQRLSAQWRDMNAPGTASFALHNEVCKRIADFAAVGAMYRPVR